MQTATETITGQERISYSSKWTLVVMSFFPVECGTMLGNLVSKSDLHNDNNRSAMILEDRAAHNSIVIVLSDHEYAIQ
jgi:hypothetical protein